MTDSLYSELDKQTVTKAYARWAPVYDLVFGAVFERGRQAAIEAAAFAASISPNLCCKRPGSGWRRSP
jgi:hypothetical protein